MHFLRFVVEKALAGTTAEIKERLLGVEVFDRRPNYDLSADPIVRVAAVTRDYSLVKRMNDPLTGEPVVILSGLGPYGTAAASEFVSNPNYFSEFSNQAPKGWESQNIQIVLETTVVDGRVSVPRVLAEQVY